MAENKTSKTSRAGGVSRAKRVSKAQKPIGTGGPAGASGANKTAGASKATRAGKIPRLPRDVAAAINAMRDKKAEDLVLLDLRKTGGFTDYFIICSGANARQISAIGDAVQDTLRQTLNERPALAEGADRSEWILLDYFDFVVHIFSRECRAFYALERLWGNAERYDLGEQD
jgi:ribosome-associated protein